MRIIRNLSIFFSLFVVLGFVLSHGSYAETIPSFNSTTSLPATTDDATSVVYNGYVYEIGGYNSGASVATVDYAPINSNGTVGTWTATTSLPQATYVATSVEYNGYIYEIGGQSSGGINLSIVDYAPINSNGTIGSWTSTTSLPQTTYESTSVIYNGYLYEIGGFNGSSVISTVDYAPINSNGTIGTWITTTSLPVSINFATSIVYNGYLYEIGGRNNSNNVVSTVYYASINSTGTLGTWTDTTSLPAATNEATSVVYNGYIYEIGGNNGSSAVSTVDYAPINSNGTVGTWTATTSLPQTTYTATSVVSNGYLYEIGGDNGSGLAITTVYYGQIQTPTPPPQANKYTILGSNGDLYFFGTNKYGDMSNIPNSVPSKVGVGYAQTPNDLGYYILTSDGGIYTFGNAQFHGSVYNIPNAPVKTPVAIATTPHGNGYYVLTADGAVYTFGDAVFHGSLFNIPSSAIPDRTPVAFGVTPDGGGYYIVTQNGAVYTFGDAQFHGSTYNIPNAPVKTTVAFSLTPSGNGYYLVTKDGGVYTFGDAQFYGSMFNIANPPVRTPVAFKLSIDGLGYYMVTADGGVYTFGDANFLGSIAGIATPAGIQ